MREVQASEMRGIALGAAVLGTGGGGDPYIGRMWAESVMERHGPVRLITVDELGEDALVLPIAGMGAPTVMIEKLPRAEEAVWAVQAAERYLGRKVEAVMCAEAGGINSCIPFAVASQLGLPLVDADGMGRAFPELQMVTMTLHGLTATPMAMVDEKGNSLVLSTVTNQWTERFARSVVVDMGGSATVTLYPMSGAQVRTATVHGTLSLCQRIGDAILRARADKADAIDAVLGLTGGRRFFTGKVTDVLRRTEGGFARGEASLSGLDQDAGSLFTLYFQNEHLVAKRDGHAVITTPDLIAVLDADTGEPITTEALRFGYRVTVVGLPCDPQWRTPEGIALVGPRYFRYDLDYVPLSG